MKGDFATTSQLAWGGVIFAGIIIATVFFFQIRYMDYMAVLKTPPEKLKVIEVANSVKNCFLDGKYYVTEEFLNRYEGKDLDEMCGFRKPGADADVIDMETGKMWKFDSKINEPEHSLWISIAFQDFEIVKDNTKELHGKYVIYARWETGLGIIEANDVFIDMYPSGLYPKESSKVEELKPGDVKGWVENLKNEDVKEGLRRADFGTAVVPMVDDVIPPGQKLSTDGKINPTFSREALVRIFKGVKEIHTGRLNVRL